ELRRTGALLDAARRIACPVVAIHGDSDPHPAEGVERPLGAALADFRFILLERCGHTPWLERGARRRFFEAVAGARDGPEAPRDAEVPRPAAADLDSARAHETARAVWVPNRNGILVNIAAGFAESLGAASVVVGFNREEAETFPDNTLDFAAAATAALGFSTLS